MVIPGNKSESNTGVFIPFLPWLLTNAATGGRTQSEGSLLPNEKSLKPCFGCRQRLRRGWKTEGEKPESRQRGGLETEGWILDPAEGWN
jgi:hypothetical protein